MLVITASRLSAWRTPLISYVPTVWSPTFMGLVGDVIIHVFVVLSVPSLAMSALWAASGSTVAATVPASRLIPRGLKDRAVNRVLNIFASSMILCDYLAFSLFVTR